MAEKTGALNHEAELIQRRLDAILAHADQWRHGLLSEKEAAEFNSLMQRHQMIKTLLDPGPGASEGRDGE